MPVSRTEAPVGGLPWLALALCICYANALLGEFHFDD